MIYHVSNIEWDTREEDTSEEVSVDRLPEETDIDVEPGGTNAEGAIADRLSDLYGFCVKGFTFTPSGSETVWRVSLNYDMWIDKPFFARLSVQEDVSRTQLPDKLVTRQWYHNGGIHVENVVETEWRELIGKAKKEVLRELVGRLHSVNQNIYEEISRFIEKLSEEEK